MQWTYAIFSSVASPALPYLRYALFCDIAHRMVVIPYRRLGTTYRSYLQGPRIRRNISRPLKMGPIGYPETSVFTIIRCAISRKSAHHIYFAAEAWNLRCFRYFHMNRTIFEKKFWVIRCVFWFSVRTSSETVLIQGRNKPDSENAFGYSCKVLIILDKYYDTWIFLTDFFPKILIYQISWKSVQWGIVPCGRTYRKTDMKTLIVALLNFAKARRNGQIRTALLQLKYNTIYRV